MILLHIAFFPFRIIGELLWQTVRMALAMALLAGVLIGVVYFFGGSLWG